MEMTLTETRLNTTCEALRQAWGPLNSTTVARCHKLIEGLTRAPETADWLTERLRNPSASAELYRDPEAGFMLLAYLNHKGLYRVPHDQGCGWVIYAVVSGEVEMGTYHRAVTPQGRLELVNRDLTIVQAGDCKVYLPGDIHDTRCLSDSVLLLRFTSCDLETEAREGRMIRYQEQGEAIEKALAGAI